MPKELSKKVERMIKQDGIEVVYRDEFQGRYKSVEFDSILHFFN